MWACSVDDNSRCVHSQSLFNNRYSNGVEIVAESLIDLEEERVALVEELRHTILVDEHFNALGELFVVTNLRRFVEHFYQKLLVLWSLHHGSILVLFPAFSVGNGFFTCVVQRHYPIFYFSDSWCIHNLILI